MANAAAALAGVTPDLRKFGIAPSELQAFVHGERVHLTRREFEVQRLRTRLAEVSPGWRYIHTHFGIGYRFEPERAAAS